MYGDELVLDYKRITDGDAAALDAAVRRWNIRWAILPRRMRSWWHCSIARRVGGGSRKTKRA